MNGYETSEKKTLFSLFQISILSPDYSDLGIASSSVKANVTVDPAAVVSHQKNKNLAEVVLLASGMAPGRRYPLRVAAVNAVGAGPWAESFLVVDRVGTGGIFTTSITA